METIHRGKIGRLPREIREQVNRKLDEGEPGKRLVAWLNELPEVRALLAAEFGGAVINEQNLTNWKQGGYRDWRMREEARGLIRATASAESPPVVTTEQLSSVLAARYLVAVRAGQRSPMAGDRPLRQWRVIMRDVLKLHRQELAGRRLRLVRERLEWRQKTQARQAMVGMLGEMQAWPEVAEAFREAFGKYEQRENGAESGPIKVNKGGREIKNAEWPVKLVSCSPSPVSSPPGRGDDLARFRVQESSTTSTALGTRMDVNKINLGPIKVDQGEKNKRVEAEGIRQPSRIHPTGCNEQGQPPHPNLLPQGGEGIRNGQLWAQENVIIPAVVGEVRTDANEAGLEPIKVAQGERFFEKEEVQTGFLGCPSASRRGGVRRSELAGQRPALPVAGARMDVNEAKSGSIKVDQGGENKKIEAQNEMRCGPEICGDEPSPLRGRQDDAVDGSPSGRDRQPQGACGAGSVPDSIRYRLHSALVHLVGDGQPGKERPSRVRKRCRRYRSATAVHDGSGQVHAASTPLSNQEMPTPQSACGAGSVPDGPACRIRLRQSSARQGATDSTSYGLRHACSPLSGMVGKNEAMVLWETPAFHKERELMYNFKIGHLSRRSSLLFALVAFAFASNPAACLGANPFITSIYTADPSAHVWSDGRLYVYPSHDMDPAVGCNNMDRYHVFSTADMVNWRDEGEVVQSSGVPWSSGLWKFMWAPDCAYKNGTYYFYFPHPSDTSDAGWGSSWKIGVATSIEPAKGFTNVGYVPGLGGDGMIDPAVFEDTDGQFYIYEGGGGNCAGAKLKPNMVEIDGDVQAMTNLDDFHEATWVFKRNNLYYLTYADNFVTNNAQHNRMRYATSSQPLGPWTYQGVYLDVTDCDTTHGSVVQYKGQWYQFYHNHSISGTGILRSLCVDLLTFDANGNINMVVQTTTGPPSVGPAPVPGTNTITYGVTNATVAVANVVNDNAAWGGKCVQNLHLVGSYMEFADVDGGVTGGEATIDIGFANGSTMSKLDMTVNGSDYSYLNTLPTGGWSTFTGDATLTVPLQPGKTNVIRLTGGNGGVNPDYLRVTPLPPNPWNAQIASDAALGVRTNQFGFNVMGDNWACVVETCTNLANPVWTPVVTNLIAGGVTNPTTSYFGDPRWTNSPGRYYRLRTP